MMTTVAQDKIYLKKGNVIEGKIIQYNVGVQVILETEGDSQIIIPQSSISTIMEGETILYGKIKNTKTQQLKERVPLASDKWYITWENKLYANRDDGGLGISASYIYQWKHFLSAGVGVGFDNYNNNRARSVIPVFTHVRSYLKDEHKSPFLDLKLGYGFAAAGDEGVIDSQGGFYGQSMIGVRLGSGGFRTTLGLGIQLQNTYLEGFHPWNTGVIREERQYRRLMFNIGFVF